MVLHNKYSKEDLLKKLEGETEERIVLSFYRYTSIPHLDDFRDRLYQDMDSCGCLGRVYVASEGINGQISIPKSNTEKLKKLLDSIPGLEDMRLNYALESDQKAFLKLIVRIRPKIVADGLQEGEIDFKNRGEHLSPQEFNELCSKEDTVLIDMRNHYESEVGHFKNAMTPQVATFRESLPFILEEIEEKKDHNIVMYCTGGIRCEKASAYFKSKGFQNVYQLDGGIINYARHVKKNGLENRFVGKNFVFDERLGERVTQQVIAKCHQCGEPCDTHTNCLNDACHLLFIQCPSCKEKYDSCCSQTCKDFNELSQEDKAEKLKTEVSFNGSLFSKARFSLLMGEKLDVS